MAAEGKGDWPSMAKETQPRPVESTIDDAVIFLDTECLDGRLVVLLFFTLDPVYLQSCKIELKAVS